MTTAHEFDLAVVGAASSACPARWRRRAAASRWPSSNATHVHAGASVRNFGLVTITGQDRADVWQRARRSRECGWRSRRRPASRS